MRIIVDESVDRRYDVEAVSGDPTPAVAFANQEHQMTCPTCKSRLAFRETDAEVTVVNDRLWALMCPIDTPHSVEFDPLAAESVITQLSALTLSNSAGTTAAGYAGTVQGRKTGSVLTIGAGSAAEFTLTGTSLTAAAGIAPASYTVNIVETLAGATGSPRTTTFTITIT